MRIPTLIATIGAIAMSAALINAFINGNFGMEGGVIASMPWGIVSLVDLYTGFGLFALWIGYRESNRLSAAGWILALFVLGFLVGAIYVLLAVRRSGGDWDRLWHGERRRSSPNSEA